jgi:integrase
VSVQAIDTALIMKVIEPIWPTKPETANRVRGRVESILDWATVRGYRQGENPARWRGHLDKLLPSRAKVRKPQHHNALPYPELPAFMAELRKEEGIAARALEFTILTAARTSEAIAGRHSEINTREKLWTVPADRMKSANPAIFDRNTLGNTFVANFFLTKGSSPALMNRWAHCDFEHDVPFTTGHNVSGTVRYADRDLIKALYDPTYARQIIGQPINTGCSADTPGK